MTDLTAKRARYGNGHKAWLHQASPPWDFTREIGQAWDIVQKDPADPVLINTVAKWGGFEVISNKEMCVQLKEWFAKEGIDSLELPVKGHWMWFAHHILAVQVAVSYLEGRTPPRGRESKVTIDAGRIAAKVIYTNYNV